jgi:hypothetical protein
LGRLVQVHGDLVMEAFETWLRGCRGELGIDVDSTLERVGPALDWFRAVYDRLGPIPVRQLRLQLEEAQREALAAALAIIAADVRGDDRRMVDAQIQERPSTRIPGNTELYFLQRELDSWIVLDAVWEIGDLVQDEIMERDFEAWPVCDQHGFGLHLGEAEQRAVWWCQPGNHAVRVIYPTE